MFENLNLGDVGININVGNVIDKVLLFLLFVGIIIVVGGSMFFIFRSAAKKKKNKSLKKIGWWEEVHSEMIPSNMEEAEEITIPGTRLKVFYISSRDVWLPRFTRGITKDLFYVCITPKRELVNFTLKSLANDMAEAGLNYDHTDMIWASENIRDYIKRTYKDKSQPWWKAYQGVITTAIYIMVMTFSFVIILYFMRQLVGDIREIVGMLVNQINNCAPAGSGLA